MILWKIPKQKIEKNVGKILNRWLEGQLIIISIYHIGLDEFILLPSEMV